MPDARPPTGRASLRLRMPAHSCAHLRTPAHARALCTLPALPDLRRTQVQDSVQASGLENAIANGTRRSSPVCLPGDDSDFDTTCSGD